MMELSLSAWGPYSKRYAGISHIANEERGIRFDLSVFPGLYRRKVDVPNVTWESGYHPWEASADLRYYSFRHEVIWKDAVYCDIAYIRLDDQATLIRCEMVNNTDANENMVLHYMASLAYPVHAMGGHAYRPMQTFRVENPPEAAYLHALAYADMGYAVPRPTDNLMPDALKRGELRYTGLVGGSGLGAPIRHEHLPNGFGCDKGDWVRYTFTLPQDTKNACMQIRYAQWTRGVSFSVAPAAEETVTFAAGDGLQTVRIALGDLQAGEHTVTLKSLGGEPVLMDSILIGSGAALDACRYLEEDVSHTPAITIDEENRTLALKYPTVAAHYGLYWDYDMFWVREILNGELDTFMRENVHHHTNRIMHGDDQCHFTNVFQRPIPLAPHSSTVLYGIVASAGDEAGVFDALQRHAASREAFEARYAQARATRVAYAGADAYTFGQERMAATTLTNLVYPVYRKGEYIYHNTPGRWWDSLYTWDSGFIGIGLVTMDHQRAMECLDTYLTEVGDAHNAFIHHGSVVPTQFYLMNEIWNATQSREWLAYAYPRLRQYYEFFVGRLGSSSIARLSSGMLKTWDYFYNSGGWDDYPPQVYVHKNKLTGSVAPAITTAQAVRCARMLKAFAQELGGLDADIAQYDRDTERLMGYLDQYAYDKESGYYGYVTHDDDGHATGILRAPNGENFNMGLDGLQPMLTGMLDDEKLDRMVALLMEPGRMWSDIGVSSVDQKASYFTVDGYWNGAVWMPHQWFIYKALLDIGRGDEAWRIAETALKVWQGEVETSYHCFEHFIVQSGRGAGWHQFSGLSSPVLYWHSAYFVPGRLTFGYDTWVKSCDFDKENTTLTAEVVLQGAPHRETLVIASMAAGHAYSATIDGEPLVCTPRTAGAVEIRVPNRYGKGTLRVEAK